MAHLPKLLPDTVKLPQGKLPAMLGRIPTLQVEVLPELANDPAQRASLERALCVAVWGVMQTARSDEIEGCYGDGPTTISKPGAGPVVAATAAAFLDAGHRKNH